VELANPASNASEPATFQYHLLFTQNDKQEVGQRQQRVSRLHRAGRVPAGAQNDVHGCVIHNALEFLICRAREFPHKHEVLQGRPGRLREQGTTPDPVLDYVISENASKWRDAEPFLTTRELKNTWSAFFSARPQSAFTKKDSKQSSQPKEKKFNRPNVGFKKLPFIDVCYNWNKGTCSKQAGSCFSLRGVPLRHVCDHRTDPSNLMLFCGQNHKRLVAHP
jgi:hypothetical protein